MQMGKKYANDEMLKKKKNNNNKYKIYKNKKELHII